MLFSNKLTNNLKLMELKRIKCEAMYKNRAKNYIS